MEKEIKKIVLTGGPCAGKTTALSWIQNYFGKIGYKVLFVNETATELINSGVTPWEAKNNMEFQSLLMKLQIDKENAIIESTKFMNYDKFLIVCDRGILDNKAYINESEFNECLKHNNIGIEDARNRYDAVFHLVTAAKGAEENYNLNNQARTEGIELARKLDTQTLNAWVGHPHLRVIDNSTNFEEKMKRLMKEITGVLQVPYTYEIERKYLIEKPNIEYLESLPNCQKVSIIQTYLKSDENSEKRIRQRGINGSYTYTLTTKYNVSDIKRIEVEKRLSEKEYLNELMNQDPNMGQIIKTRYTLIYNNQYFEIDIYPIMENEAILEIELSDENDIVDIPDFINVIKEVTNDIDYRNHELAKKLRKR